MIDGWFKKKNPSVEGEEGRALNLISIFLANL